MVYCARFFSPSLWCGKVFGEWKGPTEEASVSTVSMDSVNFCKSINMVIEQPREQAERMEAACA
jgi:hypothetical protein